MTLLKAFVVVILVTYLIFCAALFLFQRKILYFPQPAAVVDGVSAITFPSDGINLSGWLVNPGQEKALLYYGGNAEQVEYNAPFFQAQLPDYSVYLIPYRGYGNNAGEPTEANLYRDAETIYDQVKGQYDSISAMGRSLGSGVATYMAVNRTIEKLVLVSPYDSIENVAKENYGMFPVGLLLKDKFLSWRRAKKITIPTLVLIANNDQVVYPHRTDNLIDHFNKEILTVVRVPGTDHGTISIAREYYDSITNFLK